MPISKDPTFPLFPILSCLGFILVLIPFPWHARASNSGTCAFMIWTALNCLVAFVNSVIWVGSVANIAPVWCDISTQILLGAGIGIPASILCISRRLYMISNIQTVSVTREDKRKAILIDLCIAVGIPIVILALHTIVHPHRFDIFEDVGCTPTTYNTLPAYFLYSMWPLVLATLSLVYSCLNLRSFYNRRVQFSHLVATTSGMNTGRYLRLMLLSCVDIMFTLPLSAYLLYASSHGVVRPWISWEDTHYNFGRVGLFPALLWRNEFNILVSIELTRWVSPFCALSFFALFGFAAESKKNYRLAFWWVAKKFGFSPRQQSRGIVSFDRKKYQPPGHSLDTQDTLPIYVLSSRDHKDLTSGTNSSVELGSPYSPPPISPPAYTPSVPTSPTGSFISLADTENPSRYSIPSMASSCHISISSAYAPTINDSTTLSFPVVAELAPTHAPENNRTSTSSHFGIPVISELPPVAVASDRVAPEDTLALPFGGRHTTTSNGHLTHSPETNPASTLRPVTPDRVYLARAYYPSSTPQNQPPSPPPFHRPFQRLSLYPITKSFPFFPPTIVVTQTQTVYTEDTTENENENINESLHLTSASTSKSTLTSAQ
ncbi:hypothetical protein E1B28_003503 [Marasmius oreades]|uniref:Pheromone receptor n=1 Tax=Marasmius oreades TaxID=181124 RepID=A0A9P7RLR6_9AGAR|nr:uncharacterized protein E1B28_003503 [Marasmius oreades]KAG7085979.1 hypothetical protein E1B28_003503 [Marasmius oreades]